MESFLYGSLAQIRILLLPVGNIRRSTFEKWAQNIRNIDTIRLGDLTTDVKDERSRFMPNHQLASGQLHIGYPSLPPPESHAPLALFRASDFPLAVVGIASCGPDDSLAAILSQFQTAIREVFPLESMFPRASNCFVFEENDSTTNINLGEHFPGLVVIPSVMGHKETYIGTLIADLCSKVLVELATLMQTLESPLGNEYLNASPFPILPPSSEIPRSLDDEPRRESLPPLPSHNSQPDLNGQLRAKSPLGLRRASTMSPGALVHRHASLPVTPSAAPKKRPTTIGAASSHGRLFKVLADFFLLAGRLQEATIWYTEAIVLFKSPQDVPWHASALEGLATIPILEAWASTDGVNGSSGDKNPWSDILEKLTQAINLYQKATPTSDPEATISLTAYLYCSSVLRHSTLLYSVWSSKGWGPLAFTAMLQPGPSPFLPATLSNNASPTSNSSAWNTYVALERLTSITGITRAQISASIAQAHGPWLIHLDPRERIRTLSYISAMFGALGHVRKEAYVLREVLGCIMEMVVSGRDETGSSSARVLSAGLGNRDSLSGTAVQGTVGVRENERTEGNECILDIVKHLCRIHGIDLEAVKLFESNVPNRCSQASQSADGAQEGEDSGSIQEPFGWPELQIDIIWWAISIAEALPDYTSVAQFSLSALKLLHPVMTSRDQHQLYTTASKALMTAKRRGDSRVVDYWSGQPVTGIMTTPLPLARMPIEKPISILSQSSSNGATSLILGVRGPFLYNPKKITPDKMKTVLVQNESFDLVVTLQNPYVFDLDLQILQLSTAGVPFVSKVSPVIVPANSFHPVTITGKALKSGILTIRGCIVQAPGGVSREFILPLSTDEQDERRSRGRSAIKCETGRSKHAGLASRPWERFSKRGSTQIAGSSSTKRTVRFVECTIVPEQPLLRIRRTSLTHGAVMLYNGEMSTISITLENVSSLPIDFIRLTFDDSTITPAQQALADGDMSVFDTYETEYDLVHRPVFTWDSEGEAQEIGPGHKRAIIVNCFGKVGCESGTVNVAYAYVRRPQEEESPREPPEVFHMRQLSYPVLVTVYHMLECHAMDILSYSEASTASSLATIDDGEILGTTRQRKALLHVSDIADWCIFSIEVRNTYGLPFEVTFERKQEGVEHTSVMTLVPPGSTSRIVLPVKKLSLPEEHVSRPIPMLSDRQFVVSTSKLSAEEERSQRELFWYREELFKVVHGRWRENGSTRAGDLSLRQQRMSLPMLEALRVETARVRMTIVRYDEANNARPIATDPAETKFMSLPNEFVYLRTTVTNLSPSDLVLSLNLELEPQPHVIYQGELVDIPLGRLAKYESYEVETPLAFIACGRFDLSAEVYALARPTDRSLVGHGRMRVDVSES